MGVLDRIAEWPVNNACAALISDEGVTTFGDVTRSYRLASISKPIASWAVMVAVEEGVISLDSPVGQEGCTLRHLLAHAGGYDFDGPDPISAPERRRMYSNTGIELAAEAVAAAAGMAFVDYLSEAVFQPLSMASTELRGSPAHAMWSTLDDLVRFATEVRQPTLLSAAGAAQMSEVHFPQLAGTVPGVGRFAPSPWGLGFEIRGEKTPHWTGTQNSPSTFGHFGGAGTMAWFDPAANVALLALTDRPFDEWADDALRVWPELSDAVLASSAGTASTSRTDDAERAVW